MALAIKWERSVLFYHYASGLVFTATSFPLNLSEEPRYGP